MRLPNYLVISVPCAFSTLLTGQAPQVLDAGYHHLGDSRLTTWKEVPADPEGLSLRVKFRQRRNATEFCLLIEHRDVDDPWPILINGKSIGKLTKGKAMKEHVYAVPAGVLKNGNNELLLKSKRKTDDIVVGNIRLVSKSLRKHLGVKPVEVLVQDLKGQALPARITITDPTGKKLVKIFHDESRALAVRNGIVYTSVGRARFDLPAGQYIVHASRGMEWGVATREFELGDDPLPTIKLKIGREVDTKGFVASDTHIHTLTFSGHGDASVYEQMVALAGEGVELAISTDHNHQTDFRPYQKKLGLSKKFKSVIGNEVTTKNGHFNAFPMPAGGSRPNHKLTDWVKLVDDMRAKGAKVVILNHPRWPQIPTGPFGKKHFELNRISGARRRGPEFTFDAMELVNSGVKANDPLFNFVDWFALLNHGETITAVGASDSHTVGHAVGSGRTYVRSSTDVPSKINVKEACKAFVKGYTSISQGLFADVTVQGRHGLGSTVTLREKKFSVVFRVACAAWSHADRARLFLNGCLVADRQLGAPTGQPTDKKLEFVLETPPNDAYLVCVATGPAVKGLYFSAKNRYVLGATNPVYLDVDGDGRYRSPRHTAERLLKQHGKRVEALVEPLAAVDDAVAVQVLEQLSADDARAVVDKLAGRSLLKSFVGKK